jgi:hypothetical protein
MKRFLILLFLLINYACYSQDTILQKFSFSWGIDWSIPIQKAYSTEMGDVILPFYSPISSQNKLLHTYNLYLNPIYFSLSYGQARFRSNKSFFNWEVSMNYQKYTSLRKDIGYYSYNDYSDIMPEEIFSGDISYYYKSNRIDVSFLEQYNLKLKKNLFWVNGISAGLDITLSSKITEYKDGVFLEGPYYPTTNTENSFLYPENIKFKFQYKTGIEFYKKGYSFSPFIIVPVSYFYSDSKKSVFPINHSFTSSHTHFEIITGICISILKYKVK